MGSKQEQQVNGDPNKPLAAQVAIVTGAGRGIGKAIALGYAAAGAAVCCAARSASEIEQTVAEIEAAGGRGLAVRVDVTLQTAVSHLITHTVTTLGGLDILVINAGISPPKAAVANSNLDDWEQTIAVNLLGAYHCARAAQNFSLMRRDW